MESTDLTQDKLFMDLMTAYLAQMDSAVKISKTLSEHYEEEDKELTGDDIICGLIYRLMIPMEQDEMDESLDNAKKVLSGDSEEEDENYDEKYDEIEETYEKPEISRKIKTNTCECEVCSKVRECLINYQSYEPNDQLAQKFKDSIQETCGKYKIYI